MKPTAKLTRGPIGKTILGLTFPMMIGMVGMVIFNLIDTYFVGKLGTQALAAMGFTLPVVMLQGAISMGLGVGAAAVISRAIGTGDHKYVQRLTVDSLFLSVVLVLIVIPVSLTTIDPLFTLLGADSTLLPIIRQYMFIWYIGVPFVVIPMVGNNAIRAAGNTFFPSIIMLVAIVVNTILDPLLIFGIGVFPRMELRGAAIATVVARATTMIASLLLLHFRFDMLTRQLPTQQQLIESWKSILHIATPATLTQILLPLSMGVITRLIAGYGEMAVAAFSISSRIEMFLLSPLMALSAVLVPFVGQNAGAKLFDRISGGIKFSYFFSFTLSIVQFLVILFLGRRIAMLFNSTPAVVEVTYSYLLIVSLSYGFQGAVALTASFFNALRKPFNATLITLLRAIILYIPLVWIGSKIWALSGIFAGIALASIIAGVSGIFWVKKELVSYSFD